MMVRAKGVGSRNRKQTFSAGQSACRKDFVYQSSKRSAAKTNSFLNVQ